jgi:hypothetical protein
MIYTSIMLDKRNMDITRLMGAVLDDLVTIMEKIKLNISLTKRTRLDVNVAHSSLITQEIVKNISDVVKGYLMRRHWMNSDNGDIRIATSGPPKDNLGHCLAVRDHHPMESMRDERGRINKMKVHITARSAA